MSKLSFISTTSSFFPMILRNIPHTSAKFSVVFVPTVCIAVRTSVNFPVIPLNIWDSFYLQSLTMDPSKVKTILDWPEPRRIKDVQSFLGFANFYRRFISEYSRIVVPLTRLTRKGVPWSFSDEARASFNALKSAFTSAPVLANWASDKPLIVETDASDYALGAILSIVDDSGEVHPVAFHSRVFTSAEVNYDTHDKELLAIFAAFKIWRHYLEGSATPIDVVTDHKNLEYFSTTKVLTRRQARWSEYLSGFNFVVRFRPGTLGTKPDSLTRR